MAIDINSKDKLKSEDLKPSEEHGVKIDLPPAGADAALTATVGDHVKLAVEDKVKVGVLQKVVMDCLDRYMKANPARLDKPYELFKAPVTEEQRLSKSVTVEVGKEFVDSRLTPENTKAHPMYLTVDIYGLVAGKVDDVRIMGDSVIFAVNNRDIVLDKYSVRLGAVERSYTREMGQPVHNMRLHFNVSPLRRI